MQRVVRAAPTFQRRNPWFKRAFQRHRDARALVSRYIAEIEATDAGLGILLEGLRWRGRDAGTAVVVTSDHGENMGERGLYFHHGGLYAPTVHVPLIIRGPGITARRLLFPVASVDIAPTVLGLLGAPRWQPMRGIDLSATVEKGAAPSRQVVFSEHMFGHMVAARSAQGAYILHLKDSAQFPTYPFKVGRREVLGRVADPQERKALPRDGRVARELEVALQRYLHAGLALKSRRAIGQDRSALRTLGYLGPEEH